MNPGASLSRALTARGGVRGQPASGAMANYASRIAKRRLGGGRVVGCREGWLGGYQDPEYEDDRAGD